MATLNNKVFDSGLNYIAAGAGQATTVYLNNTEATSFADATTGANSLGNVSVGAMAVADGGTGGGRQVNLDAVADGSVTAAGPTTAGFASLVNASELLATTSIQNPQSVSSGQTFDLNAWYIQFKDPTVA